MSAELVAELAPEFPARDAHALAAALAIMFAASMSPDPAQQSDQARILKRDHVALAACPTLATGRRSN
jgi:hypothetical protein